MQKSSRLQRRLSLSLLGCLLFIAGAGQACLYQNVRSAGYQPSFYKMEKLPYRVLGEEEALTSAFNLVWVFGVTDSPNVERAILEAVNRKGGDAMIDIQMWKETEVLIIGTVTKLRIKGKVIQYVRPAPEAE